MRTDPLVSENPPTTGLRWKHVPAGRAGLLGLRVLPALIVDGDTVAALGHWLPAAAIALVVRPLPLLALPQRPPAAKLSHMRNSATLAWCRTSIHRGEVAKASRVHSSACSDPLMSDSRTSRAASCSVAC